MDSAEGKFVNPIYVVIVLAAVFIGLTGTFVWLGNSWYAEYNELAQPAANVWAPSSLKRSFLDIASAAGLGSELYDASADPIGDLPDLAPTVPNPLAAVYRNPFE